MARRTVSKETPAILVRRNKMLDMAQRKSIMQRMVQCSKKIVKRNGAAIGELTIAHVVLCPHFNRGD